MLDTLTVTKRNLIAYTRIPEALFFSSVQPIMFVLLFRYVFGGAIRTPGFSYVDFMMPGIFVQTVAFGAMNTAIGIAEDLQKGLIERFRALPMARSAVLAGRTTSDLVRNVGVVVLLTAIGYAVGFRDRHERRRVHRGVLLILGFAYALSWGAAVIGLSAPNSETAQLMGFPDPPSSHLRLVGLRPGLEHARLAAGVRVAPAGHHRHQRGPGPDDRPAGRRRRFASHLFTGARPPPTIWEALAWIGGLLVVLAPLAVHRYRSQI